MASKTKILWSYEAQKNLENIIDYLNKEWSKREVDQFKKKLHIQLQTIIKFPQLFPYSNANPSLRKAVLSKQTTIFYKLDQNIIYLAYIFDTRQDPEKPK